MSEQKQMDSLTRNVWLGIAFALGLLLFIVIIAARRPSEHFFQAAMINNHHKRGGVKVKEVPVPAFPPHITNS
jgi:hypothetical protein